MARSSPLLDVAATSAAEVCSQYELKEELRPLLQSAPTPLQFLSALVANEETLPAAVDFLAFALPKREALWWGCMCLEMAHGPRLPPPESAALAAAVRWALDPSEENRRAAGDRAEAADWSTAAGGLAQAAFESGGSLLPPDLPVAEPHPTLTAAGVRGAVHLAAVAVDPDQLLPTYQRFVALGIGLARGFCPLPAQHAKPQ